MAEQLELAIQQAQEAVTRQGDTVRSLKASLKDGKAEKVGSMSDFGPCAAAGLAPEDCLAPTIAPRNCTARLHA